MIELSKDKTKRLVAVHGWSGILLGLALYVVILTGAVAVFADEIGAWSIGDAEAGNPFASPLDAPLRKMAEDVAVEYRDDVDVYYNSAGHIVAFFHTHATNQVGQLDDKGVMFEFDPTTTKMVSRREGFGSELYGADPAGALDSFLVDLHVRLHLPDPWGLYLTGILGLMMTAAAVSGFLIHRHLIKDLFVAPRPSNLVLFARDRHVLAGSWTLPFAFVLAFTGSFLSFAVSLGLPVVGATAFGGNQMALFETLYGLPDYEDSGTAPLVDLDSVTARSTEIAGSLPTGLAIHHWARADAVVQLYHPPAAGTLRGVKHSFEGKTGRFLGSKPDIGTAPSIGDTAFGLMFALHFGDFAGTASKVIWFSLGLAMCFLTVTGLQLWLRRYEDQPLWRRFGRALTILVYGLPIAMTGAGYAYFLSLSTNETLFWTPIGFLVVAGLAIAIGLAVRRDLALNRAYRLMLGAGLIALPLLRMLSGGPAWPELLAMGNTAVVSFDLLLIIAGTGFVIAGTGLTKSHRRARYASKTLSEEP